MPKMKEILFKETTTLGVRYYPLSVHRLERKFKHIDTEWGPLTVKEGYFEGQLVQRAPEYEECKEIAKLHQIPLKRVYEQVWKKVDQDEQKY
jgi:uncharacterized protein (DUF111 family)